MVNPPITNTAIVGMPAAQAGVAAAVASTSRQVGQTLGVAISGAIAGGRRRPGGSGLHVRQRAGLVDRRGIRPGRPHPRHGQHHPPRPGERRSCLAGAPRPGTGTSRGSARRGIGPRPLTGHGSPTGLTGGRLSAAARAADLGSGPFQERHQRFNERVGRVGAVGVVVGVGVFLVDQRHLRLRDV